MNGLRLWCQYFTQVVWPLVVVKDMISNLPSVMLTYTFYSAHQFMHLISISKTPNIQKGPLLWDHEDPYTLSE